MYIHAALCIIKGLTTPRWSRIPEYVQRLSAQRLKTPLNQFRFSPNHQVYWQSDDQPKELNFFSISSDGRVASWVMSKNELKMEPVMQLKLVNTIKVSPLAR